MRAPKRKRPIRRAALVDAAPLTDEIIQSARHVGSPEHKSTPSFASQPRPRADASLCDPSFAESQAQLTEWLREGLRRGAIGAPLEGRYPRYVWCRQGDEVYEGRLVNSGSGEYKGYLLYPQEWPEGLEAKWPQ